MAKPVDRLIVDFANAGASNITFHPEASDHVDRSLSLIRKHGCKAGLALNPATTLNCLGVCIDKIDIILVMSVIQDLAANPLFLPRWKKYRRS